MRHRMLPEKSTPYQRGVGTACRAACSRNVTAKAFYLRTQRGGKEVGINRANTKLPTTCVGSSRPSWDTTRLEPSRGRWCTGSGLRSKTLHCQALPRHVACQNLARGLSLTALQEPLGHQSVVTTQRLAAAPTTWSCASFGTCGIMRNRNAEGAHSRPDASRPANPG